MNTVAIPTNGWNAHKLLVLSELKNNKAEHVEITDTLKQVLKEMTDLKVEMAKVTTKYSLLYGFLGSLPLSIGTIVALILKFN